jgi:uncharacterized membrane protein YdfJ with MMPL/SSD domain
VGLTERIARACAAHPGRTLAAWGLALLASIAAIVLVMGELTTEAEVTNNPESVRAEELIVSAFPQSPQQQVTDFVVVRSERYTVDDPQFRAFAARVGREALATGSIVSARTYYTTNDRRLVSADGHATMAPLFVEDDEAVGDVIEVVERADADPDFSVAITGNNTFDHDFNLLSERDLQEGELQFGVPAALIILLLVFGAVVAGLVPLLMAIFSIVVALGLVALLSQAFDLSVFIVNMLTGMGLALGIDYSLFVISRYREERTVGRAPAEAIGASGATASRAVLFSGSAFVVAMFGLLLVPSTIMRSLAAGAILVGITSVLAALTLLPALLGVLRDGVNRLRIPFVGRAGSGTEGRFWRAIVNRVLHRPALSLAVSTALLVLAALPVFGLKIGTAGVSTLPDDLAAKKGFVALQRDFSAQSVDPVQIVVADASSDTRRRLDALRARLQDDPRFGAGELQSEAGASLLEVPVRGDEVSDRAIAAVRDLRTNIVPTEFADTGHEAYVGGTTSENIDYFDAVTEPAPYVFAFVLGLTFVLLTVAFRSVIVAITAIVLNLLSVGAAYGLLVLVFQEGVGADLLGFQQVDTIEAWVPLFLFAVLFGLSMDYQVFLLSRIRERYDQTRDTREAVGWGVASTARIITGAALIIVAVFAGFARGDLVMFQQMGFGVAVALIIDATIIRSVLMPSLMALLGERNWYLPSWLDWLPHFEVEGHAAEEPAK